MSNTREHEADSMDGRRKRLLVWELTGAVFIFFAGALLHFAYELCGCWTPLAVFAAVNESVWEHLKMAFWPALWFAAIEYPRLKEDAPNFLPAKAAGLFVMPASIALFFYSYTAVLGRNVVAIDITSFFVAALIGQMTSYWIMTRPPLARSVRRAGIAGLVVLTFAFAAFTFLPPRIFLFEDGRVHRYGLDAYEPYFGGSDEEGGEGGATP